MDRGRRNTNGRAKGASIARQTGAIKKATESDKRKKES